MKKYNKLNLLSKTLIGIFIFVVISNATSAASLVPVSKEDIGLKLQVNGMVTIAGSNNDSYDSTNLYNNKIDFGTFYPGVASPSAVKTFSFDVTGGNPDKTMTFVLTGNSVVRGDLTDNMDVLMRKDGSGTIEDRTAYEVNVRIEGSNDLKLTDTNYDGIGETKFNLRVAFDPTDGVKFPRTLKSGTYTSTIFIEAHYN